MSIDPVVGGDGAVSDTGDQSPGAPASIDGSAVGGSSTDLASWLASGDAVSVTLTGGDALNPDGGAASVAADDGSAGQPHSSLTAALGDDYRAPSPVFHAFGAIAAPVTISFANRLIECLFSENALY